MVFDTLYGQDGMFTPRPHIDELSAPDDRTIRFRLNKPFPLLPKALGKPTSPAPAVMPEHLATPTRSSRSQKWPAAARSASWRTKGCRARDVYERFDKYKPRDDGTSDWTAGSKVVHFDRVEWSTIPDAGTKAAALQAGEQDWWENPTHDLLPLLRKDPNVKVSVINPTTVVNMMRMRQACRSARSSSRQPIAPASPACSTASRHSGTFGRRDRGGPAGAPKTFNDYSCSPRASR
jgi:ABC-type transport system substrate-binding protein